MPHEKWQAVRGEGVVGKSCNDGEGWDIVEGENVHVHIGKMDIGGPMSTMYG